MRNTEPRPIVQILVIDKTGQTPGSNWQEQLKNIVWGTPRRIEDAWARLEMILPTGQVQRRTGRRARRREPSGKLFVPYVPAKLRGGRPHPAVIVESASMAAVTPPDITYRPHLAPEIVSEGRLSDIQLERVIYAGQRHEQRLAGRLTRRLLCRRRHRSRQRPRTRRHHRGQLESGTASAQSGFQSIMICSNQRGAISLT